MAINIDIGKVKQLCFLVQNEVIYSSFFAAMSSKEHFHGLTREYVKSPKGFFYFRNDFEKNGLFSSRNSVIRKLSNKGDITFDKESAPYSLISNALILDEDENLNKNVDRAMKRLSEKNKGLQSINFNKKYPYEVEEERRNQIEKMFENLRKGLLDPIEVCYELGIFLPSAISSFQQFSKTTKIKAWKDYFLNFGINERERILKIEKETGKAQKNYFEDYYLYLLETFMMDTDFDLFGSMFAFDSMYSGELNDQVQLKNGLVVNVETHSIDTFVMENLNPILYQNIYSGNVPNQSLINKLSPSRSIYFSTVVDMYTFICESLEENVDVYDSEKPWFNIEEFLRCDKEKMLPEFLSEKEKEYVDEVITEAINEIETSVSEQMSSSGEIGLLFLNISVDGDVDFTNYLAQNHFFEQFFKSVEYDFLFNDVHVYLNMDCRCYIEYFGRVMPVLERMIDKVEEWHEVFRNEQVNMNG